MYLLDTILALYIIITRKMYSIIVTIVMQNIRMSGARIQKEKKK